MMKAMFLLLLTLTFCLGGCASINAGADYDRSIDFSSYTTAAWEVEMVVVAPGSESVSSLTAKRIMSAVEDQMRMRSFEIIDDPEIADVVMVVIVGARDKIRYESDPQRYDPKIAWCGRRCFSEYVHPHVYTEGTLSVDLFDGVTGEPVLHGWAIKPITNADRREPKKSIDKVVKAIFLQFPLPWVEK